MKRLALTAAALIAMLATPAFGQNTTGLVVSVCGTVPVAFKAGNPGPPTIDVNGNLCGKFSLVPSGTQDINVKQWAGGTLGAISNYGTSPGAVLVPGVNSYVTNIASGANIIGKIGIDQTTPGTTNGVQVNAALPPGQNGVGNVGGKTVGVCVTPTVTTANAYGTNYVVGGLLTFANAFTATGTGILQGIVVTIAHVETNGFTFVPFNSNPSNSTWTDAAVAAINSADVVKQRNPVALGAYSGLGTTTIASAAGLGEALVPGATSLYGVLIANAALTNNFTSTSEVQICVKVLDDL